MPHAEVHRKTRRWSREKPTPLTCVKPDVARDALLIPGPCRAGSCCSSPARSRGDQGPMMNRSEFRNYHGQEAARLRSLLATATTTALRARLLEQAEEHE